jgi:hypothetical protein
MIVVTKIVFRNKLDPLTHRDRYRPFDLQHPQRYYHNRRQQNKCLGMLALFQQPWNGSQLGNLRGWVMHKPSLSPCKLAPRRNLVTCVDSEGPPDYKWPQ